MRVKFEMDHNTGYCLTPCPHGVDCMVNSVTCCKCVHNFGLSEVTGYLKCSGDRK